VNGVPNQQKALEFLQAAVRNDAELMPVIRKALEECTQMVSTKEAEFQANMAPTMAGEKACRPHSGFLLTCVYGNMFKVSQNFSIIFKQISKDLIVSLQNCPASKWTSGK
jgi:hypothetical protein